MHGLTVLPYPLFCHLGKNHHCRDSLLTSAILHPPLSEFSFKTLLRVFHSPALNSPAHSEIQLPCSGPSALQGSVRPYPIPQCYFSLLLHQLSCCLKTCLASPASQGLCLCCCFCLKQSSLWYLP